MILLIENSESDADSSFTSEVCLVFSEPDSRAVILLYLDSNFGLILFRLMLYVLLLFTVVEYLFNALYPILLHTISFGTTSFCLLLLRFIFCLMFLWVYRLLLLFVLLTHDLPLCFDN